MTLGTDRSDKLRVRRRTLQVVAVLGAVSAALWLAFRLRDLITMIFVSLFVAVAMEPPVHALAKRGWRRGAATGVVFLTGAILLAVFVVSLIPLVGDQATQISRDMPGYIQTVSDFLEETVGISLDVDDLGGGDAGGGFGDWTGVVGGLVGLGSTIFGVLLFITTVAIFSFYMVADMPRLQRSILSFMDEGKQREAMRIWEVAVEKMGRYVYSRLILATIAALLTSTFLGVVGVPYAVSLGIWVGVLSQFIPVVGTYLAAVLPAVVALSALGPGALVAVLIFLVAYQQLENLVISPRITKATMSMHPAVSIGAIIAGGTLMGGIGVILALPVTAIVQAILSESFRRHAVFLDGEAPADG